MYRICVVGGFFVIVALQQAAGLDFAVEGVTIVDTDRGVLQERQTIVVREGRIAMVGPAASTSLPEDVERIDGAGLFAVPGLWDMHVHLSSLPVEVLPVFVANGVTHVRDMGGPPEPVAAHRRRIESGEVVGPHILMAGPILETERTVKRLSEIIGTEEMVGRIAVANASDAAAAVDAVLETGADFIKFRTVASRDVFFAIAAAAKARCVPLVGHAPPPAISLPEVAEAGQRSIEHYVTGPGIKKLPDDLGDAFATFREHGTHFVPTFVSSIGFRLTSNERMAAVIEDDANTLDPRRRYVPAPLIESWRQQLELKRTERGRFDYEKSHRDNVAVFRKMHEAGVMLLLGTDLGGPLVYPGFSLHDELAQFVDAVGMTPMETLRAATISAAEFSEKGDQFGRIAPGMAADFLLVRKNPAEAIGALREVRAVVTGGRYWDREGLDRLLDAAAESIASND